MSAIANRLAALDIARGFAVMGILAMNIIAFALPQPAYFNPSAMGQPNTADMISWLIAFVLVDGKMRGLFSLLFGASMLLAMDNAEMAGRNGQRAQIARCLSLGAIGLAHYLLLWWGDILMLYALAGLIAMRFTGKQPLDLIKLAFACFGLQFLILIAAMLLLGNSPDMLGYMGQAGSSVIEEEIAITQGGWFPMLLHKAKDTPSWLVMGTTIMTCEALGFMLLGMAMLKSGFLTGRWSAEQYKQTARHCFSIGLPIMLLLGAWVIWSGFAVYTTFNAVFTWSFPMRIPLAVGYAALIFFLVRNKPDTPLRQRLSAVGRMSMSNYILTSIIMTMLFYGWGLGWFAKVERSALYALLPFMWGLMLIWSPIWLRYYRHGPMEWLWRSLELGKSAPFRR
jgi:uncharacterized protein